MVDAAAADMDELDVVSYCGFRHQGRDKSIGRERFIQIPLTIIHIPFSRITDAVDKNLGPVVLKNFLDIGETRNALGTNVAR